MTETNAPYESRRAARHAGAATKRPSARRGSSKVKDPDPRRKATPNYGKRALIYALALPFLLLPAVVGKTFTELCIVNCSFVNLTPIAVIGMWIFVGLSALCIFAIIFNATESVTQHQPKLKAIIAVSVSGLFTGLVLAGLAQELITDLVVKIMR